MTPCSPRRFTALATLALFIPVLAPSQPQIPLSPRALAKGIPVAETSLIMEAIADVNYKGLEKMLKTKPEDVEAWTFARGQALLIAETGNLLLLRPPKNEGRDVWNKNAVELRESASRLAKSAASRDLNASRARLIEVANACNKCHQSFGIAKRFAPFKVEKE